MLETLWYVIFKWISVTDDCRISCEIALIWMSLDFTDDQSTLVQVMAWCHQATSHYLSQCWPKSLLPYVIFKWISVTDGWGISSEIALIWMSLDFTDDQSTLVQVMAWCRQATSHYLSQCWPKSLSPYGVTRPQWVKEVIIDLLHCVGHITN